MRTAFVSDIHGETARLEEALRMLKRAGYDRLWCLGDVAEDWEYLEPPTLECVEIVTKTCELWLTGNHDYFARIKSKFASPVIAAYFEKGKERVREGDVVYAHIMPSSPVWYSGDGLDSYIMDSERALREFGKYAFRRAIIGHTHMPAAFASDGREHFLKEGGSLVLDPARWLMSVGAVGISRDDNPALSCAIYDDAKDEFTVLRGTGTSRSGLHGG